MNTFLSAVARDLTARFGSNLHDVTYQSQPSTFVPGYISPTSFM